MSVPDDGGRAFPPAVPPRGRAVYGPGVGSPPPVALGRYWAGIAATAVVSALVALVGTLVFEHILTIGLVVPGTGEHAGHTGVYVLAAIAGTAVAGAIQLGLVLMAPRPATFFGWIMALLTLIATLLPLTWTHRLGTALATGLVNLVIGLTIWTLVAGALTWTSRRGADGD